MIHPAFVTMVGSKLYNLANSQSDTDIKGIGFMDIDELIGLKRGRPQYAQQDFKNNVEDGPLKIEGSVYDVGRYLQLCMKGNPTVIEFAFAAPQFHILTTELGLNICQFVRDTFMTKHLYRPYHAYHVAQIRKLQSMERTGKRAEIVKEMGYDCKFASHAYRLAKQCTGIMSSGYLNPTLEGADLIVCRAIREGHHTKEEALSILESVEKEMEEAFANCKLPEAPNYDRVNLFMTELYSAYVGHSTARLDPFNFEGLKTPTKSSLWDEVKAIAPKLDDEA